MGAAADLKDVEAQTPLLAPEVATVQPAKGETVAVAVARDGDAQGAARQWNGRLYQCCGDCDNVGCGSALMAIFLPFIAFGQNMRRAFGKSSWKHALAFFTLLCFAPRLLSFGSNMLLHTMCEPPRPEMLDHMQHKFAEHQEWNASLVRDDNGYAVDFVDQEHHRHHHIPFGSPESCVKVLPTIFLMSILSTALLVTGLVMVVKRRVQMRRKFGISGNACTDCLAWSFCTPCALCQETRTMWANNVEAGVWHGPTRLVRTDAAGNVVNVDGHAVVAPTPQGAMTAPTVPKQV